MCMLLLIKFVPENTYALILTENRRPIRVLVFALDKIGEEKKEIKEGKK